VLNNINNVIAVVQGSKVHGSRLKSKILPNVSILIKSTYWPTNSEMSTIRLYEPRKSETAVRGFINYLKKPARRLAGGYQERKVANPDFIAKP